jgi:hypothetical protein
MDEMKLYGNRAMLQSMNENVWKERCREMIKKWLNLVSLILSAVLLLAVPMGAWAEEYNDMIKIFNGEVDPSVDPINDGVLDGDLTVVGQDYAAIDNISAGHGGETSEFEVTGSVTVDTTDHFSIGAIRTVAAGNGTATTTVRCGAV